MDAIHFVTYLGLFYLIESKTYLLLFGRKTMLNAHINETSGWFLGSPLASSQNHMLL